MIRLIIQYFRSCFCKHDWEHLTTTRVFVDENSSLPFHMIYIYRCNKCGYVQKIKL